MRHRPWLVLALFIAICLAVGGIGSIFTASSVTSWYPTPRKPAWRPPAAVFGPARTTLYIPMGTAARLVWRRRDTANTRPALAPFGIQPAFNPPSSGIFF